MKKTQPVSVPRPTAKKEKKTDERKKHLLP
jgi:hypothetical protein